MLRANQITADTVQDVVQENVQKQFETLRDRLSHWLGDEVPWYVCSFTVHFVGFTLLALFAGSVVSEAPKDLLAFAPVDPYEVPTIEEHDIIKLPLLPPPDLDPKQKVPTDELLSDKWSKEQPGGGPDDSVAITSGANSLRPGNIDGGGVSEFNPTASGDKRPHLSNEPFGGSGARGGTGLRLGRRGPGVGDGSPEMYSRIAAALVWLARHQSLDGSWSLQGYVGRCTDKTCTGQGSVQADSAATALGVLPFLAVGQTHRSKGPYQHTLSAAIAWLVRNQRPDGDLRGGSTMYAQGLATIALCETYAMTGDKEVGQAAQGAVEFLERAQNATTGGWRYLPGDEGDLSVMGWEVMALKSAQMAGLKVIPTVFERAGKYLQSVSSGSRDTGNMGQFAYQPGGSTSNAMSAVGLLCTQYLGASRNDPIVRSGTSNIMQHLPENSSRDLYYWYYASQVMHNQPGPDWDIWNRKMRNLLIEGQCREGCASGSWDPQHPIPDRWGAQGGRVMTTSLATLTLEVYFRYLPLYKFEPDGAGQGR